MAHLLPTLQERGADDRPRRQCCSGRLPHVPFKARQPSSEDRANQHERALFRPTRRHRNGLPDALLPVRLSSSLHESPRTRTLTSAALHNAPPCLLGRTSSAPRSRSSKISTRSLGQTSSSRPSQSAASHQPAPVLCESIYQLNVPSDTLLSPTDFRRSARRTLKAFCLTTSRPRSRSRSASRSKTASKLSAASPTRSSSTARWKRSMRRSRFC